jgi:tripartite-type tricarboxylate transporter receptor subunit TctC
MKRRPVLVAATAAFLVAAVSALADAGAPYPSKPIKVIVPTVPGSPPDVVARILGERLGRALGQPVVVENRPGAIGTIGLHAVARAAPDGYTLGILSSPYVVAPSLLPNIPYDIEKDLAPVSIVTWQYPILVVPAAAPVQTVADLAARAKAAPGMLKFSSGGNGTPPHLLGELFKRDAGVDMIHVPYKGAPAAVAAVVAGDVDVLIAVADPVLPHLRSGKLRALATAGPKRMKAFPELPTLIELGYPSVEITIWNAIVAPRGAAPDIVSRLHSAVAKTLAELEVRQRFEAITMEVADGGPEALAALIHSELRKWSRVVRETGIKAD